MDPSEYLFVLEIKIENLKVSPLYGKTIFIALLKFWTR